MTLKSKLLIIVLLSVTTSVHAQKKKGEQMKSKIDITKICGVVENKIRDLWAEPDANNQKPFLYEEIIFKAAGVSNEDADTIRNYKIRKYWNEHYDEFFVCSSLDHNLQNKSIVRLAVKAEFSDFLISIAEWGVDFNKPDSTDGMTVIEFIRKEKLKTTNKLLIETLDYYEKLLLDSLKYKHYNYLKHYVPSLGK